MLDEIGKDLFRRHRPIEMCDDLDAAGFLDNEEAILVTRGADDCDRLRKGEATERVFKRIRQRRQRRRDGRRLLRIRSLRDA